MPTVLAIRFGKENVSFVAAQKGHNGTTELLGTEILSLDTLNRLSRTSSNNLNVDHEELDDKNGGSAPSLTLLSPLQTFRDIEFDFAVALLPSSSVLYKTVFLPFGDPKRIEQVVPLQLQDSLPFDTEGFALSNSLLDKISDSSEEFEVLCSIANSDLIKSTIDTLVRLGFEPKVVSTRAQAIALLPLLYPESMEGSCAILEITPSNLDNSCALAIFVNRSLRLLREFPVTYQSGSDKDCSLSSTFFAELLASIVSVERSTKQKIGRLYLVSTLNTFLELKKRLSLPVELIDLQTGTSNTTGKSFPTTEIGWSMGIFTAFFDKHKISTQKVIDFRVGALAYKPAWKNIWNLLKDELVYIVLALVFAAASFFSYVYGLGSSLSDIDSAIKELIAEAAPNETAPYSGEISYFENRISAIEGELGDIGSLSALSPLDSVKELSNSIGKDVDVELESLSIGHSRIDFRGSVPDNPTWGKLSELLQSAETNDKKKKFCEVNISPQGKTANSRIKISAEIKLCE